MADLVTLDEYKESMGITSTKDDMRISALLPGVSALVKTYCSRSFVDYVSVDKVETISITYNTSTIQVDEFPIISVTKVEERTSYSSDYEELTEADFQFYVDSFTDSICKTNGSTGYSEWYMGPGSVRVTYKAGFVDIPEDLKLATIDLITYYYKDEYKGYKMLNGAATNTPGTTTQKGNVTFPDHIKRVLDLYKNFS